ncbi:SURF1 family protein [Parvularcula marina]|uniref:SURF1 family protein n=1 Tax=Parvularcula marina TaxID=2292771 RepID=UPI0035137F47
MNPLRRPVLSAMVLAAVIVLVSLGTWQVKRLHWKEDLIATVEARMSAEPVSLTELFEMPSEAREWQAVRFPAEGRGGRIAHVSGSWEGTPGYFVFTLVRLPDGGELPVNHGFVPSGEKGADYTFHLPAEMIGIYRKSETLTGLAKSLTPVPDREEGIFYARDPEGLIAWLFGDMPPEEAFYIERSDNAGAGERPLGGTSRVDFPNNHLGYAMTWYGLAIGLIFIYGLMMRSTTRKT